MIEQTESRVAEDRYKRKPDEVREFAQRVAAKHLVSTPDRPTAGDPSVIDRGIGALMRAVLHNRDFQALEAIWRATFLLVRQLETGSQLKLYVIDISKQELAADLKAATDLRDTGIYRLLVEQSVETQGQSPGRSSWGTTALVRRARMRRFCPEWPGSRNARAHRFLPKRNARLLGSSFLASESDGSVPHPREWKMPADLAAGWADLRHQPDADSVGLATPRFLLRLPYGKKTSPLESFDFEEFPGDAGARRLPVGESGVCGRAAAGPVFQRGRMGDASGRDDGNRSAAAACLSERR